HQSVRYTDAALRNFFETSRKEEWFDKTIFIVTADHTSINETPEFQTYRGKYAVPLMIYSPSLFGPKKVEHIVQHMDIYPTILQMAGKKSTVSMGRSLLDTMKRDVIHYDGNVYVITNDSLSLQWNGVTKYELFEYKSDPAHTKDIAEEKEVEGDEMFNALKMFIQKFNYRLLNDDFN
ncbi:MAG: sulfatase-like hydrolase/transferase, partial [Bacteroidia bacterium]